MSYGESAAIPGGSGVVVPLFPLPNLFLFPGTLMPLHIFEPRYRQMIEDASPVTIYSLSDKFEDSQADGGLEKAEVIASSYSLSGVERREKLGRRGATGRPELLIPEMRPCWKWAVNSPSDKSTSPCM